MKSGGENIEKHSLQTDGKTWVLNETCQIDGDGNQLDETESMYIWVEDFLCFSSVDTFHSKVVVPLKRISLPSLLKKLQSVVTGSNIICLHNLKYNLQYGTILLKILIL